MPDKDPRVEELMAKIDAFMANGGGHMNVRGGECGSAEIVETRCTTCCGQDQDPACNTPVKD